MLIDRLSTLSHPQRMAVFRLLMRRCPVAVPAGEIAQALDLKASTASAYLSALTNTGLITQSRDGTKLLYTVNLDTVRDVVRGLLFDCCRGRADLCPPQFADMLRAAPPKADEKYNVLFVCSGNSARSIMAETILRDLAGDRFVAHSAGTAAKSALNPQALMVLKDKGHDTTLLRSKRIDLFQSTDAPVMDFVFTVCDRAANEDCPPWHGQPTSAHWGLPDPSKVTGSEAEQRLAFDQTYDALHKRIIAFANLPFATLDRAARQQSVDDIAKEFLTQE